MNRWKIFSKEKILSAKFFDIFKIELQPPDRKKRIYYQAERNPSVLIFPLTDNYEIFLIKQYRYLLNKEMIEGIAGFINKNENPMDAAKRELKEESGITASILKYLVKIELAASVFKSEAELFLAQELKFGKQELDDSEKIEVLKIPLEKAVSMIISGEISESATMLGILLLDRLRKDKKI